MLHGYEKVQAYAELREDQKTYVVHCMRSWGVFSRGGGWSWRALRKAIAKAQQNLP